MMRNFFGSGKRRLHDLMESWGYAAIGIGGILGVPAFLYYIYFSPLPADNTLPVSGVLLSSRAVDEEGPPGSDGTRTRDTFFEVRLEGQAVPVRFHRPVFDPQDPQAPLASPSFPPGRKAHVTVSVAKEDAGKLKTPPVYPPHRWVEGYSLDADGTNYLRLETSADLWRKDSKLALYLANAFTFSYAGLLLFFVGIYLDGALWRWRYKRKGGPPLKLPADGPAAERVSTFYYIFIPGLLVLNIPALAKMDEWVFDGGFWLFFSCSVAALQALFYFHHRRYLSIMDSKPLRRGDPAAGFFSYLALSAVLCLMITPVLQVLYLGHGGG